MLTLNKIIGYNCTDGIFDYQIPHNYIKLYNVISTNCCSEYVSYMFVKSLATQRIINILNVPKNDNTKT